MDFYSRFSELNIKCEHLLKCKAEGGQCVSMCAWTLNCFTQIATKDSSQTLAYFTHFCI